MTIAALSAGTYLFGAFAAGIALFALALCKVASDADDAMEAMADD